jgi:hypothetical protein
MSDNPASADPYDVWVTVGDSEMSGSGTATSVTDFYPPPAGTVDHVLGFTGDVEPVYEAGTIGPAGLFGWYRNRITGRKTCVVRVAVSGTNSTYYLPGGAGTPYAKTVTQAQKAMAQPGAVFKGFVLYGGANDASLASPAWSTNWLSTFNGWRSAITGATGAPIYYAQLPSGVPHTNYQLSWNTVRADQAAWQAADRIMIAISATGPWKNSPQDNTNINFLVHQETAAADVTAQQFATAAGGTIPALTTPALPTGWFLYAKDTSNDGSGFVNSLTDPSVPGRSFTQATAANRPTYSAADANWKSTPTGTWDGSNDELSYAGPASDLTFTHSNTGMTLLVAARATGANADVLAERTGSTAPGNLLRITGGYLLWYMYTGTGGTQLSSPQALAQLAVVSSTPYIFTIRITPGTPVAQHSRVNGRAWGPHAVNGASVFANTVSEYPMKLGFQFYRFAGQIKEIIIYDRALTDGEATAAAQNMYMRLIAP